MDFLLLGPFEVRDGDTPVPLPRKKHRALLALLLLRAGEVVSADVLVEELWGEQPPKTALAALRNYVSQLRTQLGADLIETRGSGYVAHVEPEQIDVVRFERLAAQAREAMTAESRASELRAALSLWRGTALADLAYEPFGAAESARLEELRLTAREDLVDAELELGRHGDLIPEMEALIAEHPFRERLRGQLMLALYRAGRQADALEVYRTSRTFLLDELGLEPGVHLRELEQAILQQDPALDVPAVLPSVEERLKTVTVLLCELVPSPPDLDPERLRRRTVQALGEARAAIERHGGSVETRAGDDLLGVFGVPAAHEDDALRAVRAAAELREAVPDLRIGIDTGEVLVGHGFVSGTVVAGAKRLQRDASPGEVLIGAATRALCGRAVTVEDSGGALRLVTVDEGARPIDRRYAPLVGRGRELDALRAACERALSDGQCRLVTIVGEPGIGKTRLATEFVRELEGDATVLVGRCAPYGAGAAWLPLREVLEQAGKQLDPVLESAGAPGEVFLATRRILEQLATEMPLVIGFDDVHWAAPTLLDLVEYLAGHAEGPILSVCLARPELLEERPEWPGERIRLEPLTDDQAQELAGDVEPDLRDKLVETCGGNPLFLEQLVVYAKESGTLEGVPPSVEALLAARLDLLGPEELDVLQRAAVVGRLFETAALRALDGDVERLPVLEEKSFVRRLRGGIAFHHVLVREVAYASVPKEKRAELHERLADWLDGRGAPDELIGHHLEQAFRYRVAVGLGEGRTRRLALDAGHRLGEAGIAAWKRGDTPAATDLLGRAADVLPDRDPYRLGLLCELGPALRVGGDLDQALKLLSEAVAVADEPPIELRARLELAAVRLAGDAKRSADEILEIAAEAVSVFEAVGDERSLARTWRWVAYAHGSIRGRWAASKEAAERALELYRRTGWSTSSCFSVLAAANHSGPTPAQEAIEQCQLMLTDADLGGQASILCCLGGLEAMIGRFAEARQLIAGARAMFTELGQDSIAASDCDLYGARIELLAGDAASAAHILRESCETLYRLGDHANLATRAADLADALRILGHAEEAQQWCALAEETGAADDLATQIGWRSTKAKLLAQRMTLKEAERLAREAVGMAEATDALNNHAKTLLDLAEVLRLAGRAEEAREAAEEALILFGRKGNIAGASRAESRLAELAPA
jgi:DNA-binding SARP family transcriptional activator/tetratricopeptide (TPR) repeat protein